MKVRDELLTQMEGDKLRAEEKKRKKIQDEKRILEVTLQKALEKELNRN